MNSRFSPFVLPLIALAPLASGCSNFYVLQGPPPEPIATPAPTPYNFPFDATQGTSVVGIASPVPIALNGTTRPGLPNSFRTTSVESPDSLVLQGVYEDPTGRVTFGTADSNNPVRLAGIVVPAPNRPGYAEAMQTVRNWAIGTAVVTATPVPVATSRTTAGRAQTPATTLVVTGSKSLDVFQDPKFPIDVDGRRLVQVFFKSSGPPTTTPKRTPGPDSEPAKAGDLLSLNRMLVRSGWAFVDLYSPTSFDQQSWLLDEKYAQQHNLGLWRLGIMLQQRVPARASGMGSKANVTIVPNGPASTSTPSPETVVPIPQSAPKKPEGGAILNDKTSSSVLPAPSAGSSGAAPGVAGGATGGSPSPGMSGSGMSPSGMSNTAASPSGTTPP